MLQNMRDNIQGTAAKIIIAIIVVPLAFLGIESIFGISGGAGTAIEVNGEAITTVDFEREKARLKQMMQSGADDEQLTEQTSQTLIQRELLNQAANKIGLRTSPALALANVKQTPEFQQNGKFDSQTFDSLLRRVGFTQQGYLDFLAKQMRLENFLSSLEQTGYLAPAVFEDNIRLVQQTRNFKSMKLSFETIKQKQTVTDEAIQAYYDANTATFQEPERLQVSYLRISESDIADTISIETDAIKQAYESELEQFNESPEREAAHIQLTLSDEKTENDIQKTIQAIQSALAKETPFETLAKQYSDDTLSAKSGGYLGKSTGDVFPEPFEQALAKLTTGSLSEPIKIDNAYHIIKLISQTTPTPPTYEASKTRIETALKKAETQKAYQLLKDKLESLTFEADDLQAPAKALGLDIQTTDFFANNVSSNQSPLNIKAFVTAAFDPEVKNEKLNSTLVELSANEHAVLRIKDSKPAHIRPLDEVKETIKDIIASEQADKVLQQLAADLQKAYSAQDNQTQAQALLKDYKDNQPIWESYEGINRQDLSLPRELVEHVFLQDAFDLSHFKDLTGNYYLVELTDVQAGSSNEFDDTQKQGQLNYLAYYTSQRLFEAYQTQLQNKADIESKI